MNVEPSERRRASGRQRFDAFYDEAVPVVHGYLIRLCGGDTELAWDLTQDTWLTFVRRGDDLDPERMSIGYLLTIARSRWLDHWRRTERLQRKLRLVWAAERHDVGEPVARADVLDHVTRCQPAHRTVLVLTYLDDLPVAQVATSIGRSLSGTYALLERARAELRRLTSGARDD